jgi:tRNA nucleotidyltransferase (CCA-adding enzyme)
MNIKSIHMPREVEYIIDTLNNAGFEAYIVGGCVRDSLMGKTPQDWDISTSAKPFEVCDIFPKTINTGIKHGTVTVLVNGRNFEVTTYRIDGKYSDNRHPDHVVFTSLLEEDLSRRDFTANAIAYNHEKGFIDPFGGFRDISDRIIRTVGNADERFREDALRMLRAIRFSAQLDFNVDSTVLASIKNNSYLIMSVSRERIGDELTKILISNYPVKLILLRDTNLLQYILPEFEVCFSYRQNNHLQEYNVAMHTLCSISNIENDKVLRWTMLLHDIGRPLSKTTGGSGEGHFHRPGVKSAELAGIILKRLKFSKKNTEKICRLVRYHDMEIASNEKSVRKFISAAGEDIFLDILKVKEADKKAQNLEYIDEELEEINKVRNIYYMIKESGHCLSIKDLAVNGNDLLSIGCEPGRGIGNTLEKLLEIVIEDPELNRKDVLINIVKNRGLIC